MARQLLDLRLAQGEPEMIKLTWLPNWQAYAVRVNNRVVGMVMCKWQVPFRQRVEFA